MEVDRETWNTIQDAVQELVGKGSGPLALALPTLDVSRPNIHDSKTEFRKELDAVEAAIEGADQIIRALLPGDRDTNAETAKMTTRVQAALDSYARQQIPKDPPNTVIDLIRKNRADTGLYRNSLWNLIDLRDALDARYVELMDQEREFWQVNSRPPNYYARAIALRLARLYAKGKGERPTFGTARDGGHPSTDFGRTLEIIFGHLGIDGGVKRPAKYAIEQLTDEDLQPRPANSLVGLLGAAPGGLLSGHALDDVTEALKKGRQR